MIYSDLQEFFSILDKAKGLIGIDFGDKKLGIAISNPEKTVAMPLRQDVAIRLEEKIKVIEQVLKEHRIGGIVLGLPTLMNGNESEGSIKVRKFALELCEYFSLPCILEDERLTSLIANNFLKSLGYSRKARTMQDDKIAACVILESVLLKFTKFS